MAYDEGLAERIREILAEDDLPEKKMFPRLLAALVASLTRRGMFGGIAWMFPRRLAALGSSVTCAACTMET